MNWCCFQKSPYSDPFLFVSLLERKSQIMLFLNSNPSDGFSSQSKIIALLYKTQHDLTTRYLLNIYGVFFLIILFVCLVLAMLALHCCQTSL